ncbi:virion morphogenesis family protein [uncultured Mediterranean phage uvDeep-CGR2-AD8-C175]|nr:virion morphogenesis family protein [uncultured Mediterranean phage uvDeep-CGR2-AD8-C175]
MLKANIKTNAKHLQKKYKKLEQKLPRLIDKGLLQAGFHLLDIIRTKTSKGIDYKGVPFAPYSEGYLKQLQREGKSTKVDLFYTGRMLGALTPSGRTIKKTGKNKVSVNFSNAQMRKRALFNQVLNEPKREFFGFNQRTESIIQKGFNKFMIRQLNAMRI